MPETNKNASRFITNQQELLSDLIKNIMPASSHLRFLVGYFYFSGFEQIYKAIGLEMPLKILVGMEAEATVSGAINEIYQRSFPGVGNGSFGFAGQSNTEIQQRYTEGIVQAANTTDLFDSTERETAFRFFLEKIQNGSLEIRKTAEPNHAKLYLFGYKPEIASATSANGVVITGSSNLTWSGISDRYEVNVILRDGHDYTDAERIFTDLWICSIPLIDERTKDSFFTEINKTWVFQSPKPWLMFLRVLDEYFSPDVDNISLPDRITNGKYFTTAYQTDAIRQGLSILKNHSGCIIADVVGLGKSIIASTIAYNRKLRTLVIAPPHLEEQWNDYLIDFNVAGEVFTSGKISQALKQVVKSPGKKLIIIDEAHRYRNEGTIDYGMLHKICLGNEVLLLTATPFNNRPSDIFSLVKLFQIPSRPTIQTTDSLASEMFELMKQYRSVVKDHKSAKPGNTQIEMKKVAQRMREILSPLVIRRTRLDLERIESYRKDLNAKGISFAKVCDPEELDYELGNLGPLYASTLTKIGGDSGFIAARYKPLTYLKQESVIKYIDFYSGERNLMERGQLNLAQFMKRLLVRRFESSVTAFRTTLNSLMRSYENTLHWYNKFNRIPLFKKGIIPDAEDLERLVDDRMSELYEETLDEILASELSKEIEKGLLFIDGEDLSESFIKDVESDLALLKSISAEWSETNIIKDPKFEQFAITVEAALKKEPERKIIVFSEFADTVHYLAKKLSKKGLRILSYSSDITTPTLKSLVRMNFDAGASEKTNDYDILVATDAISEGFSLHRAGAIYNYDIPYNPTRVIQRVGRINRINQKVFDELHIYNFFPTITGEEITNIKTISTFKIAMIQAVLGSDMKVLTAGEETGSWFSAEFQSAQAENESLSWDAEYLNILHTARDSKKGELEAARAIPRRARIGRAGQTKLVLFSKNGKNYRFVLAEHTNNDTQTTARMISPEQAMSFLKADLAENALQTSNDFQNLYRKARSELEEKTPVVPVEKLKTMVTGKLDILETQLNDERDREYIQQVRRLITEFDTLPEVILKDIKQINPNSTLESMEILHEAVPVWYISAILRRAAEISGTESELILSEEWL